LDAANTKSYVPSSTSWNDISRGGNSGTLINGPTFNSANGGSIVFDGVDDYSQTENTINLVNKSFTIITWCNLLNSGQRYVFGGGEATLNRGLHFGYRTTNQLTLDFFQNATNIIKTRNTNIEMLIGMYDYDPSQSLGSFSLGVNGQILQTTNKVISPFLGNITAEIGRVILSGQRTNFGSGGSVYQTLLYYRTLSTTEVLQNYNATKSRFGLL
jgi:hypothetical protein